MKIKSKRGFWQNLSGQMKTLLSSALGFVAALAWNDAIQALIKKVLPLESASSVVVLKFLYAIAVTTIAVILIFYLSNIENLVKNRSNRK